MLNRQGGQYFLMLRMNAPLSEVVENSKDNKGCS